MSEEILTHLYRAFDPTEVLQPGDQRAVNCDAARHDGIAPFYARQLRLANPAAPLHLLFTGHIGVGKSTELLRLKRIAEQPLADSLPLFVIYFDVNDHLDLTDIRLPDLLILIAGQVHEQLRSRDIAGFSATNVVLQRFWDQVKQFLNSDVALSELSFETGIVKVAAEIKNADPVRREKLRNAIDSQRDTLRNGVNELLTVAGDKLREQKIACQIVIIADGLEKTPTHRHEELFIDGSGPLADVPSHIIYTVPMPLAYHPRFSTLTQVFANEPIPVPMLHVDSEVGMECFREIIQRRCEHCNLGTGDVFDSDDTRDFLCRQTGGHIRTLMMLVQSTLVQVQALPIQLKDVEASLRHYRFGLARRIPGAYWPWLRMFRPGALAAFPDELPEEYRRDMLHQLFVYEYTNGVPSFDVNPVIRDLPNFLQGEPAVPIPAAS